MEYKAFQALTVEEQAQIADAELPEVPAEMLRNSLTKARAFRKNGVMGWEITQKLTNGIETEWSPTVRTKEVSGVTVRYLFNPQNALYEPMLEESEPSMEEEPIGGYGMAWMHFMEDQHPDLVDMMMFHHRYLTVARSVDRHAWEYRELLDRQYEQANPRPTGSFEKIYAWEKMREFETDGTVMREIVLVPVTTP